MFGAPLRDTKYKCFRHLVVESPEGMSLSERQRKLLVVSPSQ